MGFTTAEAFLKNIRDLSISTTGTAFIVGTYTLTATPTAVSSVQCKAIELLSTVTLTANGVSISYPGGILPCNNASEVLVSGSGSVSYILYL
jgi:hypothetical protein